MSYRKQFILWLFEKSQQIYTSKFKNHQPWKVTKSELLKYPTETLGRHLGEFLKRNNFELLPKVERHDAYHVLTGYSTKVEDEIALQCLCFGNGKRSPYLLGAIILGLTILPDYIKYYYQSFCIGKSANSFHQFDYQKLLKVPLQELREAIFAKKHLLKLKYRKYE